MVMVMGLLAAFFWRTMGYRHGQEIRFLRKKVALPNVLRGNA